MGKVVLAYSGGLDTSVSIVWLKEKYGLDVVALAVDVGQGADLEAIRQKALRLGAVKAVVLDLREEFVSNYAFSALKANAAYEKKYFLNSALSRPLIVKALVDVANEEGAVAVAHGCTGKGNDQVRFDVGVKTLAPHLKVIAPVREWGFSREEEIEYAKDRGIPVPVTKDKPYSIDQNVWGRSIECGVLEDPWVEPPEDVFEWTVNPTEAPDEPEYIEIGFKNGVPVSVNGMELSPLSVVEVLNEVGGRNGVGRIDHIENRLVGIKSREVYEYPGASILVEAHFSLEKLVFTRDLTRFKEIVDKRYSELIYDGLWFSQLREALATFIDRTQEVVTGTVRMKLYRGSARVVGLKSPYSMYDFGLSTYDKGDKFDHSASEGFIKLWGLPHEIAYKVKGETQEVAYVEGKV